MLTTVLAVVSSVSFCFSVVALGLAVYAIFLNKRTMGNLAAVEKTLAAVDKQISDAIDGAAPDIQKVLDGMAAAQNTALETLAKEHGEAMALMLHKQSEINKDHKANIERLNSLVEGHNKLLRFELDLPGGDLISAETPEASAAPAARAVTAAVAAPATRKPVSSKG